MNEIITVKYPVELQGLDAVFEMEERLENQLSEYECHCDGGYGVSGYRDMGIQTNRYDLTLAKLKAFFKKEKIMGVKFGKREQSNP